MKKTIIFAALLIMSGAAVAIAMSDNVMKKTFRYKTTININTPDGVKSGSAVRELTVTRQPGLTTHVVVKPWLRGEAVVVDLGDKGKLFGLIHHDTYYELIRSFIYQGGSGEFTPEGLRFYDSLEVGEKAELKDKKWWPKLVKFQDITDAKSIELVNKNNISETYGEGYKIKNIIVEITNKSIEWGKIEKVLPERYQDLDLGRSTFKRK